MFSQVISIVVPVFAVALIGFAYQKAKPISAGTLNQTNLDVFVPILIFSALSKDALDLSGYTPLILATVAVVLLPGILSLAWSKVIPPKVLIPPMMFRNTGNLGLPLAVYTFGEEILPLAVLLFVIANTLHFTVGLKILTSHGGFKLLRSPMIIATILGLTAGQLEIPFPLWLERGLDLAGQVAIPLMLFTLGTRMVAIQWSDWIIGSLMAIWAPLSGVAIAIGAIELFALEGVERQLLILYSLLPPAVLNYLLADQYHQSPNRVATIVLFGNAGSLLVYPIALPFII
ncbi:AEC family transporter [Hahella ganghwensis]|uniref:AEC family transporter n=1 Tax=Hahella ganghwensis TaxID=286420 RepID=UPI00035E9A67|nr:AEC family transporter [Hahella ganghwensis]